ncbi:MAG: hypothetical protein ACRD63_02360, partial [Pyrinomonadaceae bacterium]
MSLLPELGIPALRLTINIQPLAGLTSQTASDVALPWTGIHRRLTVANQKLVSHPVKSLLFAWS